MNLAQRIKWRLQKLGKTERGASLEAGLSDSYLRNIRQNKSSSPRIDTLEKIAEVLNTTPGWLMTGEGAEELPPGGAQSLNAAGAGAGSDLFAPAPANAGRAANGLFAPLPANAGGDGYGGFQEDGRPAPLMPPLYSARSPAEGALPAPNGAIGRRFALSERHLPVYGQAVGGIDGEFPMNGMELYTVLCPPQLSEVSGAYAVSISGDSMYPRYEDGEIVFVDPTKRVKKGDYVIAQIQSREGDPPLAYVKRFIRHNAGGLVLEQLNPAKELVFPHNRVLSVHYIALAGAAPI